MLNKIKKVVQEKLKKQLISNRIIDTINKYNKNNTEFEIPANAQYNPRIPDLVNGVVQS